MPKQTTSNHIKSLLKKHSFADIDIGCGENKMPGTIGIDYRAMPGVDIVWDLTKFPWPIPSGSIRAAVSNHVIEHIPPFPPDSRLTGLIQLLLKKKIINPEDVSKYIGEVEPGPIFIRFMDEVWRILKPDGEFGMTFPYGSSPGFLQDPTHCLLEGSEVLTRDGFKDFRDVNLGEKILTIGLEDGETKWSECVEKIDLPYQGDILTFKNRAIDIAVTPNHDLVWKTSQPIKGYHKSAATTFEKIGKFARRGLKTIPDWRGIRSEISLDFMEFLGWVISEGSFVQKGSYKRILIFQSRTNNPVKFERIKELLQRMGLTFKESNRIFYIKNDKLFNELSELGKSDSRFIPTKYKNLSSEHLVRLLEGLMLGDGEKHPNGGGNTYTTISERLAKDVSEISVKAGLNAVIRKREGKLFISPSNSKTYMRKDQYRVSVTFNNPMLYPKPQREHYRGNIVCLRVKDNNTILTRYNGHIAWVGNCNPRNEVTWWYFDPLEKNSQGMLYSIYKPKPWRVKLNAYTKEGNMEVVLVKRRDDRSYYEK